MAQPADNVTIERLLADTEWLLCLARHLVATDDLADEVVQETRLAALRRPPRGSRNLPSWISTVMHNVARQLWRTETRRRRMSAEAERRAVVAESAERASMQRHLTDLVLALREPYRSVLLLRYFEGMPPRDIAALLGEPLSTVKTRLRRGLQLLRERLDLHTDEGRGGNWRASLALLAGIDVAGTRGVARWFSVSGVGAAVVAAVLVVVATTIWVQRPGATELGAPVEHSAAGAPTRPSRSPRAHTPRLDAPPAAFTTTDPSGTGEGIVLFGVVRTPAGRPAEGARVVVGRIAERQVLAGRRSFVWALSRGMEFAHEATTDAEGRWQIDGFPWAVNAAIAAVHDEHGVAFRGGVEVTSGLREHDLVLHSGRVVAGVVAANGSPVPGASVALTGADGAPLATMPTDSEGRFRSPPLVGERRAMVAAFKPGYLALTPRAVDIASAEPVQLELRRARVLSGAVRDPGHRLRALDRAAVAARLALPLRLVATASDPRLDPNAGIELATALNTRVARGVVSFDEGRYEIALTRPEQAYLSLWYEHRMIAFAAIPQQGSPDLEVGLERVAVASRQLALQILDAATGERVAEAHAFIRPVTGHGMAIGPWQELAATEDGIWRTVMRSGVRHEVLAVAEVHMPERRHVDATGSGPLDLVFPLVAATHDVTGTVRDERDQPVPGVFVHLLGEDGRPALPPTVWRVETNAAGRFRIPLVAAGKYRLVTETTATHAPSSRDVVIDGETPSERIVQMRRGVPVSITPVTTPPTSGPMGLRLRDGAGRIVHDDMWWPRTLTGRAWRIALAPGAYTAEVLCPGYTSSATSFSVGTIDEESVTVELERATK